MIIMQAHLFDELREMQRESLYSDECSNMDDCTPESHREIAAMFADIVSAWSLPYLRVSIVEEVRA